MKPDPASAWGQGRRAGGGPCRGSTHDSAAPGTRVQPRAPGPSAVGTSQHPTRLCRLLRAGSSRRRPPFWVAVQRPGPAGPHQAAAFTSRGPAPACHPSRPAAPGHHAAIPAGTWLCSCRSCLSRTQPPPHLTRTPHCAPRSPHATPASGPGHANENLEPTPSLGSWASISSWPSPPENHDVTTACLAEAGGCISWWRSFSFC